MILFFENRSQRLQSPVTPNSCFIAHAYVKADWGNNLVADLKLQKVSCISPFLQKEQMQFLDSAVKDTLASALFMADLSVANLNVTFELGTALGLGKPTLMLRNADSAQPIPTLLQDVRHFPFFDRNQVITEVLDRLTNPTTIPLPANHVSPLGLGPWQLALHNEFMYFPGKARGDIHNTISKTINSNVRTLRYQSYTPVGVIGSELEAAFRHISTASCNIFRFVSVQEKDHFEVNHNQVLLAGYSYGLGKRTICILPNDVTELLADIREASLRFATEGEIVDRLGSCIGQLRDFVVAERTQFEAQLQGASRVRHDVHVIKRISFGDPEAANDDLLLSSYKEWPFIQSLLNGSRSIVVGRKGTGKTALKRVLVEKHLSGPSCVRMTIEPIDEELGSLYHASMEDSSSQSLQQLAAAAKLIWLDTLTMFLPAYVNDQVLQGLPPDLINRIEDFNRRLFKTIGDASPVWFAATLFLDLIERHNGTFEYRSELLDWRKEASDLVGELKRKGIRNYILFDSLDQGWHTRSKVPMAFLVGLIEAVNYTRGRMPYSCVLFVRLDIYRYISRFVNDIDKVQPIRLDWATDGLRQLLYDRLKPQIKAREVKRREDYFSAVFEKGDGKPLVDSLIEEIELKPREAITLANNCLESAVADGRERISLQDLTTQSKRLSEDRLFLLNVEHGQDMPWMEKFLNLAIHSDGAFSLEEWRERITEELSECIVLSELGDELKDAGSRLDQVTSDLLRLEVLEVTLDGSVQKGQYNRLTGDIVPDEFVPSALSARKVAPTFWDRVRGKKSGEFGYALTPRYRKSLLG